METDLLRFFLIVYLFVFSLICNNAYCLSLNIEKEKSGVEGEVFYILNNKIDNFFHPNEVESVSQSNEIESYFQSNEFDLLLNGFLESFNEEDYNDFDLENNISLFDDLGQDIYPEQNWAEAESIAEKKVKLNLSRKDLLFYAIKKLDGEAFKKGCFKENKLEDYTVECENEVLVFQEKNEKSTSVLVIYRDDLKIVLSETNCLNNRKTKKYSCCLCGNSFSISRNLKNHMRTHTGEKPHECNYCGKGFSQSGSLKNHILTHTGEKPYTCNKCGKSFNRSGTLNRHMRIHAGEKPYQCQLCEKGFKTLDQLKKHKRIHTGEKPHQCNYCGKCFTQSGSLKTHMLTHTGEKPYTCQVERCGKSFALSGDLKKHMRTHTGEKPYKCKECGKGFAQLGNLGRHMGTQHKGDNVSASSD